MFADHGKLRTITEQAPHLTRLLWLDTLVDGAIHREWIVAMGRRSKTSHLAHLICELFVRLQVVNRTSGMSFNLPLSQAEMADVLGLSVVHMNRVIGSLKKDQGHHLGEPHRHHSGLGSTRKTCRVRSYLSEHEHRTQVSTWFK